MFATTKSTAPGPDRGTATSYWPSTRWARKPRTEPTCAPISNGEICASMPLMACISAGMESPWARIIASDTRCAAGSSSAFMLSAFALIHSALRIARTSATSVGASRPVNRATCSSATRTASVKPERSSSVGSRSSPASTALATPTWRASSQLMGPLEDAITRCISRNNGASRRDSGSIPNGKPPRPPGGSLIPPSYDRAFVTMAPCHGPHHRCVRPRASSRGCSRIHCRRTRRWRSSPTPARAAPACSWGRCATIRTPGMSPDSPTRPGTTSP